MSSIQFRNLIKCKGNWKVAASPITIVNVSSVLYNIIFLFEIGKSKKIQCMHKVCVWKLNKNSTYSGFEYAKEYAN